MTVTLCPKDAENIMKTQRTLTFLSKWKLIVLLFGGFYYAFASQRKCEQAWAFKQNKSQEKPEKKNLASGTVQIADSDKS